MNYAKLRGRIREIFGTQEAFAKAIGLSKSGVSMRLNGKVNWTAEEIERAKEALDFGCGNSRICTAHARS